MNREKNAERKKGERDRDLVPEKIEKKWGNLAGNDNYDILYN